MQVATFSAHGSAKKLEEYMASLLAEVHIAIAGLAAHLLGFIASRTLKP